MNTFRKILNNRLTIFFIILSGLIIPELQGVKRVLPCALGVVMFLNFLTMDTGKHSLAISSELQYLAVVVVITPFLVYRLSLLLDFDTALRTGLIMAVVTPSALSAPVVCDLVGGNRYSIITHVILTNLLAPLTFTLIFAIYLKSEHIAIPYTMIITKVALLMLCPYLLAWIVKKRSKKHLGDLKTVKKFLFLLIVFVAVSSAATRMREVAPVKLAGIALFIFTTALFLYGTGFLIGRCRMLGSTTALMFGHKNMGLSLWIALGNFDPMAALPLVLYIISHHIINGFLLAGTSGRTNSDIS